jgi:hypothetical protein
VGKSLTKAGKNNHSFHLGGGGPAPRLLFLLMFDFGNLIDPTESLKTLPIRFIAALTINDKSLVTIPTTGRRTDEARSPAMLVNATSKTTISPSDQRISMPSF